MKKIAVILLFIASGYSFAMEQDKNHKKGEKKVSFAPQYTEITFSKIYNDENKAILFQTEKELEEAQRSSNLDSLLENSDQEIISKETQKTSQQIPPSPKPPRRIQQIKKMNKEIKLEEFTGAYILKSEQ